MKLLWEEILSLPQPGIPRLLTAAAEWGVCVAAVFMLHRRFSEWLTALLLALFLPVQIVLRCGFGSYGYFPGYQYIFAILMLLNVGFMLFVIAVLCRESAAAIVFWWAAAVLEAEFAASLSWQICSMATEQPSMASPGILILSLFIVAGSTVMLHKLFRSASGPVRKGTPELAVLGVLVMLITFMCSNILVLQYSVWQDYRYHAFLELIGGFRTLSDICGIFILWLILNNLRKKQMEKDKTAIQEVINMQYRQYMEFRENSAYIAQQSHDLKHQTQALRKHLTGGQREEYLQKLEDAVDRYSIYCNSGNPVLDTILTQKLMYCYLHDIQLGYRTEAEKIGFMETEDICNLFGNLLDNAIEHVEKKQIKEERQILLTVAAKNAFVLIRVENCSDLVQARRRGLPKTTKKDAGQHGYGGKSILYTAEKYGGSVTSEGSDGWFTVTVLIPDRTERDKKSDGGSLLEP